MSKKNKCEQTNWIMKTNANKQIGLWKYGITVIGNHENCQKSLYPDDMFDIIAHHDNEEDDDDDHHLHLPFL